MRLGIVGHGQEKFTVQTETIARQVIREAIYLHGATVVVSGGSPMGGVDLYAEKIATTMGIATNIKRAHVNRWAPPGEYGYRARNLDIAAHSDIMLCVVVQSLPPGYKGMTFDDGCYHCRERLPAHIKSGGCWTT